MDFARLMTFEDFNADFHCEKHPDIKAEVNRSVLYIYECHIKFHVLKFGNTTTTTTIKTTEELLLQ